MKPERLHGPVDLIDVEARARRLRAEALAGGFGALKRWLAQPFHRRHAVKA